MAQEPGGAGRGLSYFQAASVNAAALYGTHPHAQCQLHLQFYQAELQQKIVELTLMQAEKKELEQKVASLSSQLHDLKSAPAPAPVEPALQQQQQQQINALMAQTATLVSENTQLKDELKRTTTRCQELEQSKQQQQQSPLLPLPKPMSKSERLEVLQQENAALQEYLLLHGHGAPLLTLRATTAEHKKKMKTYNAAYLDYERMKAADPLKAEVDRLVHTWNGTMKVYYLALARAQPLHPLVTRPLIEQMNPEAKVTCANTTVPAADTSEQAFKWTPTLWIPVIGDVVFVTPRSQTDDARSGLGVVREITYRPIPGYKREKQMVLRGEWMPQPGKTHTPWQVTGLSCGVFNTSLRYPSHSERAMFLKAQAQAQAMRAPDLEPQPQPLMSPEAPSTASAMAVDSSSSALPPVPPFSFTSSSTASASASDVDAVMKQAVG